MPHLILKQVRDRKAYRLRCRFQVDPAPSPTRDFMGHGRWMRRLEREKVRIAEVFVRDMKAQGWENLSSHGFTMRGPFPMVAPVSIVVQRTPSAREMLSGVQQGQRFRDAGGTMAQDVQGLGMSEWWEFELAGTFVREAILVEVADRHEEMV
ncbi:MAG: hypothetical protein Q8R28_18080 [Dehalococcoidia bacterium]|nr:hypothetical protein [Dehalococcoidia bacterium]